MLQSGNEAWIGDHEVWVLAISPTFIEAVLARIPEIARNHHEWCNGQSYPLRLKKEELDLLSRITPLADVFEALTAPDRPYRKPATVSQAQGMMQQMAQEGHLDSDLLEVFIDQKMGFVYGKDELQTWQLV